MSRIFDALRQSEIDKVPGAENWNPIPATASDAADPSAIEESFQTPEVQPGNHPTESAPFIASPHQRDSQIPNDTSSRPQQKDAYFEDSPGPFVIAPPPSSDMPRFVTEDFAGLPPDPIVEPVRFQIELPKLKVVPVSAIPSPLLVALSSERGLGAEKFRVLGTRLSNIRLGTKLGVLQVTSSVVGEGKTLTSVNLAMTLATRFAQKVLLVEGDLRKPAVCSLLGMNEQPGIGEWWQETGKPISELLLRIGDTGMCILPAGTVAHPTSVLQSPRIAELLGDLERQFDWIIIDTPPLLPMADSNLWSRVSDGTLLVVRKGVVSRAALKKAVASLDNPKLIGIVLNDASDYDRVNYYDHYYTGGDTEAARKAALR